MATLLLTQRSDTSSVRLHRSLVTVRIWVWLRSWQLDYALAHGVAPDSSAALSLRAYRLIGPRRRRALARELRRLPATAARPQYRFDPHVRLRRREVVRALELLNDLADRLEAPEPVDARGVAQVLTILRDAESPLFRPGRAGRLAEAIEAALDALEPEPALDWLA